MGTKKITNTIKNSNPVCKIYICPICKRGFTREDNMVRHVKLHTGEAPLKCTTCGCTFVHPNHLKLHTERFHPTEPPQICGLCKFQCKNYLELQDHFMEQHEDNISTEYAESSGDESSSNESNTSSNHYLLDQIVNPELELLESQNDDVIPFDLPLISDELIPLTENLSANNQEIEVASTVDEQQQKENYQEAGIIPVRKIECQHEDADIFENRESDILGNGESDIFENRERDIFENRESDILGNRESDILGNGENDIFENRESDIFENKEGDVFKNDEIDNFQNPGDDIFQNKEGGIFQSKENDIVQNNERDISRNQESNVFEIQECDIFENNKGDIFEHKKSDIFQNKERHDFQNKERDIFQSKESEMSKNNECGIFKTHKSDIFEGKENVIFENSRISTFSDKNIENAAPKNSTNKKIQKISQKKPYECGTCYKIFVSRRNWLTHMKRGHSKDKNGAIAEGKKLSMVKKDEGALKIKSRTDGLNNNPKNSKVKNGEFSCGHCIFSTNTKSSLNKHMNIHTRILHCKACDFLTSSLQEMSQHVRTHPGPSSANNKRTYNCTHCGHIATTKSKLKVHNDRSHPTKRNGHYQCKFCDFQAKSQKESVRHMVSHTGEKPFACRFCRYRSIEKSQLRMHERIHTGEKPYACQYCEYRASQSGSLKNHIAYMHSTSKPFPCTYKQCNYRASISAALKKHLENHAKNSNFRPKICLKSITKAPDQNVDNLTKNPRNLKRPLKTFACTVCDFRSAYSHVIKRHSQIHTREKPFSCAICAAKFTHREQLKRHQATHPERHVGEKIPEELMSSKNCDLPTPSAGSLVLKSREKERGKIKSNRLSCGFCPYKGASKWHLDRHAQTHAFSTDKPYRCDYCQYGSRLQRFVDIHVKKYHRGGLSRENKSLPAEKNFGRRVTSSEKIRTIESVTEEITRSVSYCNLQVNSSRFNTQERGAQKKKTKVKETLAPSNPSLQKQLTSRGVVRSSGPVNQYRHIRRVSCVLIKPLTFSTK